MALYARTCSIQTYGIPGGYGSASQHRARCTTHNVDMEQSHNYRCAAGIAEEYVIQQANTEMAILESRINALNELLTPRVRTFMQNLEKLEKPDGQ